MTNHDARDSEASHDPTTSGQETAGSSTTDFGPDPEFARKPEKTTNTPVTEQLFGARGVRVVHYVIYTVVFAIAFAVADLLYAIVFTVGWLISRALDYEIFGIQSTIDQQFIVHVFSPKVVGAALFTAFVITGFAYYLNEVRFNRGEWIRTFL